MKKRSYFRKRKVKRTSSRKLSPRDLSVLDFLWTWKVASTAMLGDWAYKDRSAWWVYKALRQLQSERYIQLLPRGKNVDIELWALTDLGFEVVLMDRDDILFHRYRPHAPAHDYLATCLQLGELWQSNVPRQFFTEQMIASLAPSNFPKGFRSNEGHVPDGITLLEWPLKRAFVGYEVDLNLKDEKRYRATFSMQCGACAISALRLQRISCNRVARSRASRPSWAIKPTTLRKKSTGSTGQRMREKLPFPRPLQNRGLFHYQRPNFEEFREFCENVGR